MNLLNLKSQTGDYSKIVKNLNYDLPIHYMFSNTQFEITKKYIQEFELTLDTEHAVGVMLTNFGQTILMEVTEITYEKSVVLVFKGKVNGQESTLIQHINQLNFLLTSVPIKKENPRRKIGFMVSEE
ncbi:MAG: DUF6173 family protein [Endomicrobiaceae bacterium]|nr:DUF6173 family protein [Endomicrobiaceae bacterium]MDD3922536.1 DUF6173 family protein [Endomicrobiaceae bacterium]